MVVAVSIEKRLLQVPLEAPELQSQVRRQVAQDRKYDAATRSFPQQFGMAFGCDALYQLIRTSLPKVVSVMKAWVEAAASVVKSRMSSGCITVLDQSVLFARAFIIVCGEDIADMEGHNAFTSVFMPTGKQQAEFIRLLVLCCRREDKFKAMEVLYVRNSDKELQNGGVLRSWVKDAADGKLTIDSMKDICMKVPAFRDGFRPGATAGIEQSAKTWAVEMSRKIMSDEADEPDDSMECLEVCRDVFFMVSCTEAETAELQEIRGKVEQKMAGLRAASMGKDILALGSVVANG
jgi:hypothetical protein